MYFSIFLIYIFLSMSVYVKLYIMYIFLRVGFFNFFYTDFVSGELLLLFVFLV